MFVQTQKLNFQYHIKQAQLREAFKLKNVTKSGKSPPGGGRSAKKHQKVHNSKFGHFDKKGGGLYFRFFSQM